MKNYVVARRNNEDFFEDTFNSLFRPFYVDQEASVMKTDIRETDSEYVMDVDMAGFDKQNIALKYENGYLTVSAKKSDSDKDVKYVRRERAFSCSRSYYLGDVNEKLIKAKYENGVLQIVVPKEKPEEVKHTIAIE